MSRWLSFAPLDLFYPILGAIPNCQRPLAQIATDQSLAPSARSEALAQIAFALGELYCCLATGLKT